MESVSGFVCEANTVPVADTNELWQPEGALLRLKSVNAGLDVEFHCFDTDICSEINLMRKQLVIWSWFYLQDETKELMVLKLFKNIS